jgi:hypothetical protein
VSVFVDLKAVRYSSPTSNYYYFEDKGLLYRGQGKRVIKQNAGTFSKFLTLEMRSAERVLSGVDSQNPNIQAVILSYGLPILKQECGWERQRKEKVVRK